MVSSCAVIRVTLWLNPRSHLLCQTKQQELSANSHWSPVCISHPAVTLCGLKDKTWHLSINICLSFEEESILYVSP